MTDEIRHPEIEVQLSGLSGNAGTLMGAVTEAINVLVREQRALSGLALWPDEAEALGVALIKAAVLARNVQGAKPRL